MMTNKLLKQKDLDSEIMAIDGPMLLFWQLSTLATGLIVVVTWLALIALMVAGVVALRWWLFIAVPILAWLVALAMPALVLARRGALAILESLAMTAEAWLARAGYSVDLNNDGMIGHHKPVIEPVQDRIARPIPVTYNDNRTKMLMANDAPEVLGVEPPPPARPSPIVRKLWELPNGVSVPAETLNEFIEGVFIRGISRGVWCPKILDRDSYTGLIALFEQARLIDGRKAGFAGKLTVKRASQVKGVLGINDLSDLSEPG